MSFIPDFQWQDQDSTHVHANNTDEQDVIEIIVSSDFLQVGSIILDLVNLTQNATIRTYVKIDDTNYRVVNTIDWTTSDGDGVIAINELFTDHDMKVTLQSSVTEGASRDVPYTAVYGVI